MWGCGPRGLGFLQFPGQGKYNCDVLKHLFPWLQHLCLITLKLTSSAFEHASQSRRCISSLLSWRRQGTIPRICRIQCQFSTTPYRGILVHCGNPELMPISSPVHAPPRSVAEGGVLPANDSGMLDSAHAPCVSFCTAHGQ